MSKKRSKKMDTVATAQMYMRGEIMKRSGERRNSQRDHVMRLIFSKPGFAKVVAAHVGLTLQAVAAWDRVPAKYVQAVSQLVGIEPEQIRPDIFLRPHK
jgi:hypothetical protein